MTRTRLFAWCREFPWVVLSQRLVVTVWRTQTVRACVRAPHIGPTDRGAQHSGCTRRWEGEAVKCGGCGVV